VLLYCGVGLAVLFIATYSLIPQSLELGVILKYLYLRDGYYSYQTGP
jgi:hypothetical protein